MPEPVESPVARAQMLIRKPAAEVFAALVDPALTSRFWFSRGSGPLEPGKRVRWEWEMYGFGTEVEVKAVETGRRILVEWDVPDNPTCLEWTLEPRGAERTMVKVRNWGFRGDTAQVTSAALDSTGGFSFVLAAMKAFLEHGVELKIVEDHDPDALVPGWRG
jgi:uncharacterized protein YndB with AHSA1/START domain